MTFNEKVNWRIVNDRRELLVWTCDKALVKGVARSCGIPVPETYWFGTNVDELPFDDLPPSWVLKPNNGSGMVLFGDQIVPGRAAIVGTALSWDTDRIAEQKGEWAYTRASPGFLLERRIGEKCGAPNDYKVYVFDGVPRLILVDVDRFGQHRSRFYSPEWKPMPFRDRIRVSPPIARPKGLQEMLEAAATIADGFDFLRVDFYLEDDEMILGEVSAYPGGGLEPFSPRSADIELGKFWTIPESS